jgi:ribosomal protein L2
MNRTIKGRLTATAGMGSTMVLRVIEAPHGNANAAVNAEIERAVGIAKSGGLSVEVVCSDGDRTCVSRLAAPFAVVNVRESDDLQLPLHG